MDFLSWLPGSHLLAFAPTSLTVQTRDRHTTPGTTSWSTVKVPLFDVAERFLTSIVVLGARLGDSIMQGSTSPCKSLLVLLVYCAHEFPSIFLVLSVSQEIASDALKRNDDSFPLRL